MSTAARARGLVSRLAWPVIALLPGLVAMRGMFSTHEIFSFRDNVGVFWPTHLWFRHAIAAGEFPLWDPYMAFGQSAVADPLRHLFFPPMLLMRLVPGDVISYNLSIGLAIPCAAVGLYVFLRLWLDAAPATIGAVVFSASSSMLSTTSMPNLSWCMALAPWVLWAVVVYIRTGDGWRFSLLAALVAVMTLAGEPVTLAVCLAVAGIHGTVVEFRRDSAYVRRVVFAAVAMLAGIALTAIQYLPLSDAVSRSGRSYQSSGAALYWSLHPARILEFITPVPFGDSTHLPIQYAPWYAALNSGRDAFLISHFLGIAIFVLAALGIVFGMRRRAWFWTIVAVVTFIASLGAFTPLYPWLVDHVPALLALRFPEKYFLVTVLALAVLAAEGWQAVVDRRVDRWGVVVTIVVVAVACAVYGGMYAGAYRVAEMIGVTEEGALQLATALQAGAVHFGVVALAVVAAVALVARDREHVALARWLLAIVVVLDLVAAGAQLNPTLDTSYLAEPDWVRRTVAADARSYVGYRLFEIFDTSLFEASPGDPDFFYPTIVGPLDASYLDGEAIFTSRTAVYPSQWGMREALSHDVPVLWPTEYILFTFRFRDATAEERARLLDRVGVRTQVLRHTPIGDYSNPEPIDRIQPIEAYFSSKPFNRALVVPESRVETNRRLAIDAMFREDFRFESEAVLDRELSVSGTPGAPATASAEIVTDRANHITIDASAPSESIVVLLDSYNPGWQAVVDGIPAEIGRADGLFMGVRVPPGRHTVSLTFRPRSLVIGAWVSGLTALLLAVIAAGSLVRRRGRPASRDVSVDALAGA
ncbi:MAG TPA: YfhO family protein [Blastocatellia bacterium]|nr:YfhO family protein [Blastocatellia bacterium]